MNQKAVIAILVIIILAGGAWLIWGKPSQPADTSAQAPVQTGAENQAPAPATVPANDPALVGTWKSTDDAKFTRTFRADGTVTDSYEGDASATNNGTWKVYTAKMELPAGVTFQLDNDVSYIQIAMDSDTFNYRVSKATSAELELIYMDRGGVLRFKKVN